MTRFEKWVYLLYNSKKYASKDSKLPSEIESEAGMAEVVDYVKKSNSDKEMRARMEDRENSLIALSLMRGSAYKKGKIEGRKDEIKEIIKNMLSNGFTKDKIIKITGISEKDFNECNIE
jgi:predicted transposase/invertase (TIGR01784 family)